MMIYVRRIAAPETPDGARGRFCALSCQHGTHTLDVLGVLLTWTQGGSSHKLRSKPFWLVLLLFDLCMEYAPGSSWLLGQQLNKRA